MLREELREAGRLANSKAREVEKLTQRLDEQEEHWARFVKDEILTKEDQRKIRVWLRKVKDTTIPKENDDN